MMKYRSIVWLMPGLFGLIVWLGSLNKPIYADEIGVIYAGQSIGIWDPHKYILPHPPLYSLLLGVTFRLFGVSVTSARMIGLLSIFLTLALMGSLTSEICNTLQERTTTGILAAILYSMNPLALQGALLLDIDNTILTPLMLILLLAFYKTVRWNQMQRVVVLGALFGLALWAKLTTPLFFLASVFLLYLLKGQVRQGLKEATGISLVGFVSFAVTFGLYAQLTAFPLDQLSQTTYKVNEVVAPISVMLRRVVSGSGLVALWITPPFTLLAIASIVWWARHCIRDQQCLAKIGLLAIYVVMLSPIYVFIRGAPYGFPKYHVPMLPALCVLVAAFLANSGIGSLGMRKGFLLIGVLLAVYYLFVVGDPLYLHYTGTGAGRTLWGEPLATRVAKLLLALWLDSIASYGDWVMQAISDVYLQVWALLLPLVVIGGIVWQWGQLRSPAKVVTLALLILTLASSLVTSVLQMRANYATIYNYGRSGTMETVRFVKSHTEPKDLIIAPAEIMYYTGRSGQTLSLYLRLDEVYAQLQRREVMMLILASPEGDALAKALQQSEGQAILSELNTHQIGSYWIIWRDR
jgi:4-amino-4-deoxy-L-arabinose transferase-like glycosyltransferase